MSKRRYGPGVAVLDKLLYVVGGRDGEAYLSSCERLDPRAGKWEVVRPMSTRRRSLGSAVLDGHLYAVGGADETNSKMSSAEKYDPVINEWTTVAEMNKIRHGVSLYFVPMKICLANIRRRGEVSFEVILTTGDLCNNVEAFYRFLPAHRAIL
ncbi:kelch repeat protein [Cooperia oncophora]